MYPERVLKALNRAKVNLNAGNIAAAIDDLEKTLQKFPKVFDCQLLLGQAKGRLGDHAGAEACCKKATLLQPKNPDGWFNLGISFSQRALYEPALHAYNKAADVSLQPHPHVLYNIGACLYQLGRYQEAIDLFTLLVPIKGSADVWMLLGMSEQGIDHYPEAIAAYLKALDRGAGGYTINLNIGTCHSVLNDYDNAAAFAARALDAAPGDDVALYNLGIAQFGAGQVGPAAQTLAMSGLPAATGARLLALNFADPLDPLMLRQAHEEAMRALPGAGAALRVQVEHAQGSALRIGLVSADFREHPVAFFLEGMLGKIDRSRCALVFYSDVRQEDAVTARLRAMGDTWRATAKLGDAALAEQVTADRVHILIDLAGHTNGSRITALAQRLAPVQASYLGYCSTTGLAAMDYVLTDEVLDPAGCSETHYTEALMRLGPVFASYTPPAIDVAVAPLPMSASGVPTFGSFAQLQKISPATVRLWSAALKAVPQARMLVMSKGLGTASARARLLAPFIAAGIDPARFELRGAGTMPAYLAAHGEIDMLLDTAPWNGHTTTLHGLWMGVPTVSLRGAHHAARFGEMVLRAAGLNRYLALRPEDFGATVAALVGDAAQLAAERARLREALLASSLCDHAGMARRFEQACAAMWASCAR